MPARTLLEILAAKDIPLKLTADQALALAQLCKRICREDVARLACKFDRYPDGRMELDVMIDGIEVLRRALADAGFAPR